MEQSARIYVAGHHGLIGSALKRCLRAASYTNLLLREHSQLELTDQIAVERFFQEHRPEYVLLAAGRVGGIAENQSYPADFMNANLAIQLNVMRSAQRASVRKLIFFGSSCMYPRECLQPMPESFLLTGKPEPTSLAYAVSKFSGVQMCLAYNQQYGAKVFIPVIPNSTYGPNDDFDLKSGHVLSALIRRFHEAKAAGAESLTLWGSGNPRREFIHADDVARACLWILQRDIRDVDLPMNIGVGKDYSIKDLAEIIAGVVGYRGRIGWDTGKPDGAPRKLLDSTRLQALGWRPAIELREGLENTYEWYLSNAAR